MRQFWPFPRARSLGGERGEKRDSVFRTDRPVWCHTERTGPLIAIGPRSIFANSVVSLRQEPPGKCLCPLVRASSRVGRENIFQVDVGDRFLGYQRVGRPFRIGARICCPDGGKTPRNGVEKATFGGICYVAHNGATPFKEYIYV